MNSANPENNKVTIAGTIVTNPDFSHEVYGEKFYIFKLEVKRLSENSDVIPITVSEKFFSILNIETGKNVLITGQFRSYNNFSSVGNRLLLTVFVRDIEEVSDITEYTAPNNIFLNGYICKEPVYRTTPFGREIADILLAVNRGYNKSDYIPCIAWGRNAKYADSLSVGDNISVWGRVQSRDYQKKISEDEIENKTAYEVSVSKIELN
ncbi:MAG: single-stranded DNA-binding protein [Ruminococcaceae bacterium]|nr:single-stranded DNA-binding protein [Oscillospiraceae bacterium]